MFGLIILCGEHKRHKPRLTHRTLTSLMHFSMLQIALAPKRTKLAIPKMENWVLLFYMTADALLSLILLHYHMSGIILKMHELVNTLYLAISLKVQYFYCKFRSDITTIVLLDA